MFILVSCLPAGVKLFSDCEVCFVVAASKDNFTIFFICLLLAFADSTRCRKHFLKLKITKLSAYDR